MPYVRNNKRFIRIHGLWQRPPFPAMEREAVAFIQRLAYILTAPGARKNPHDADIENYGRKDPSTPQAARTGWNDAP